jgi:hypothetical protein
MGLERTIRALRRANLMIAGAWTSSCCHCWTYPALHRLEQAGLIAGTWSKVDGRRRRSYRLTSAGTRRRLVRSSARSCRGQRDGARRGYCWPPGPWSVPPGAARSRGARLGVARTRSGGSHARGGAANALQRSLSSAHAALSSEYTPTWQPVVVPRTVPYLRNAHVRAGAGCRCAVEGSAHSAVRGALFPAYGRVLCGHSVHTSRQGGACRCRHHAALASSVAGRNRSCASAPK